MNLKQILCKCRNIVFRVHLPDIYSAFMDRIEDKKIRLTDEDFPVFLYESGTVYDEENEDVGLFRGYVLVRVSGYYGPYSIMTHHVRFIDPSSLDHHPLSIQVERGQIRQRRKYSSLRRSLDGRSHMPAFRYVYMTF